MQVFQPNLPSSNVLSVMLFTLKKSTVLSPAQISQLPTTHNPTRSPIRIVGPSTSYTNFLTPPLTIHCQFETAYQLVLQSQHTPSLNICLTPPASSPTPTSTYCFLSVSYSTADEEHGVFVRKLHYYISFFVSFLRLTTLTCGPDDANRLS